MKLRIAAMVIAAACSLSAQIVTPAVPEPPKFFVAIGAGFNEATDPHYAATGTFGVHIGDGLYSTTSLDTSSKYDPDKKIRSTVSTLRTGAQKIITRQGAFALLAHGDIGATVGAGNLVGAFSTGGTLTYSPARIKDAFFYGCVRIIKSPNSDPTVNPATVLTAFSFGIGRTF